MGYSAYLLTEESRQKLIASFPPLFPELIAHHITYKFPDTIEPPPITEALVIGHCQGKSIECLVVSLDGSHQRPHGGTFHITFSLDRSAGAKPVHSNKILKKGWLTLPQAIQIEVLPQYIKTN